MKRTTTELVAGGTQDSYQGTTFSRAIVEEMRFRLQPLGVESPHMPLQPKKFVTTAKEDISQ